MYATDGAVYGGATYATSTPSAVSPYGGVTYSTSATNAATTYSNYVNSSSTPSYSTAAQYSSTQAGTTYTSAPLNTGTTYTYNTTPQYATQATPQATQYVGGATYTDASQYVGGATYTDASQYYGGAQYTGAQYTDAIPQATQYVGATGSTTYPYSNMLSSTPASSTTYTAPPLANGITGAGLMGTPNFVFGAGGPPLEFPDSPTPASPTPFVDSLSARGPTYSVGQSVELFSVGQNTWLQGKIIDVKQDGTVTAQYGQHQKDILKCHYEQYLRPIVAQQSGSVHGRRYQVGEDVDVFSKGEGGWVQARVSAVGADGTVSVKWQSRVNQKEAQKDIKPCFLEEYLRPSAPAGMQAQPRQEMSQPATMMAGPPPVGCPYQVGQQVEVWTSSGGGWIEAKVQDVGADGLVTVKWGVHMKRIPKHDWQGFLRPLASKIITEHEVPRASSMALANVPTALAQVPSGQLPPTIGSGAQGHGRGPTDTLPWTGHSRGPTDTLPWTGIPGSGVIPPTIPGGYSGGGGLLESSPTMVHADQSSFQVPPTAFGGATSSLRSVPNMTDQFATAPTNLGQGGPFASQGVRYHDVPTIPGGYA